MMASTSSIELTFLLGSSPLPVDRKLRAQFFILVGKTKKKAREIRTVNPLSSPRRAYFFQALLKGGVGGLIKRGII